MTSIIIVATLFIGLPWVILHHVTRWKTQGTLTKEDEKLLDELYELGRKLEERVTTIERIMSADNPGWRSLSVDPASIGIEDETNLRGIVR
jgi:phage shock protein B